MRKLFLTLAGAAAVLTGMTVSVYAAPPETAAVPAETAAAPKKAVWLENYSEALKLAEKEKKPVLVNFTGSDWCIWCIRLPDQVLSQPAFQNYAAGNLILLKVDFPRKSSQTAAQRKANNALSEKYGVRGFPTILLLNSDGAVIGKTGYRRGGAEAYVKHLQQLLKK